MGGVNSRTLHQHTLVVSHAHVSLISSLHLCIRTFSVLWVAKLGRCDEKLCTVAMDLHQRLQFTRSSVCDPKIAYCIAWLPHNPSRHVTQMEQWTRAELIILAYPIIEAPGISPEVFAPYIPKPQRPICPPHLQGKVQAICGFCFMLLFAVAGSAGATKWRLESR